MTVIYVPHTFLRWTAVFQKSEECEAVEQAERQMCMLVKSVHMQQMSKAATTQRCLLLSS